jgi:hypothetical protein
LALHFSDCSFLVHHHVNRDHRHLLAHAMATDFLVTWQHTQREQLFFVTEQTPRHKESPRPVYCHNLFTLCPRQSKISRPMGHLRMSRPKMNCKATPQITWRHLMRPGFNVIIMLRHIWGNFRQENSGFLENWGMIIFFCVMT